MSKPLIERPEPVPRPEGSKAIAKAGRLNFSFSRAAISPTMPGCHFLVGGDDDGGALADSVLSQSLGFRLLHHQSLHRLALAIDLV